MCWCVTAVLHVACMGRVSVSGAFECKWGVCVQLYVDTGYGMYLHEQDSRKTGWNNNAIATSTIGPIHGMWGED